MSSAESTVWIKTHEAIEGFLSVLICCKCKNRLSNPQQFINCGHIVCYNCLGKSTDCPECKVPNDRSQIRPHSAINEILFNLHKIAGVVKSPSQIKDPNFSVDLPVIKRNKIVLPKSKISIDDSSNTTYCESIASTSTRTGRRRSNDAIPKNINKKNRKGETPLHIACNQNDIDRVKLLLDARADPNTKDHAGWTPLQEAASFGFFEVCELLVNAGVSLNMPGCDNRTALHEAVKVNNQDIVALLLNANANTEVFDDTSKKPKDYCTTQEMLNLFKLVEQSSNNCDKQTEKSDDVQSDNRSFNLDRSSGITEPKIVLYGSNLNKKNRKLLIKVGSEKKIRLSYSMSSSVTHVIVDTENGPNQLKLTFDVLLSILYGKWILNSGVLPILLESQQISTNELNLFEVNPPQLDDGPPRARENMEKQNPKLFDNCWFYFAFKSQDWICYDDLKLSKEDLVKLVNLGAGYVLTREPKPEDIQGSLSPFHVAHKPKHSLHKCTHYIIYNPEESHATRNMYDLPILKTLPLMWFIESILRFQLLDPVNMGLLPIDNH